MKKNLLFIVTSHEELGDTGKKTGAYASEIVHPYQVLDEAGYTIDFASPEGGETPIDGLDDADDEVKAKLNAPAFKEKLHNAMKLSEVDPSKYSVVYFAGGHGTMYDFPNNPEIERIVNGVYGTGGVVSAVCHGPAALTGVKLDSGEYLVNGKKMAGFTNEEEEAAGLTDEMPFLLESKLKERGANFEEADTFKEKVVVDGRLITGQNPASAKGVGKEILKYLGSH